MERLVIFDDFANIEAAFRQLDIELDEHELLEYLSEGRFLVEAHAFVPLDPRNIHTRDAIIERLWSAGYIVHDKVGTIVADGYRCNLDVEITMELMRTAEIVKPDIIVLMSGDKDFIPVILELRRRGIRVEVAAFPGHNAAREVMLKASGFIDLARYNEERQQPHEKTERIGEDGISEEDFEDLDKSTTTEALPPPDERDGSLPRIEHGRWMGDTQVGNGTLK